MGFRGLSVFGLRIYVVPGSNLTMCMYTSEFLELPLNVSLMGFLNFLHLH